MPRLIPLALFVCLVAPAVADKPKKQRKWTVDDVVQVEWARDFQPSPTSDQVLWVKSTMNEETGTRVGHIFRSAPGQNKPTQLTRGTESCLMPRWSPDGKLIAFLSKRANPEAKAEASSSKRRSKEKAEEAKEQLWLLDATGGEPWQLTDRSRKVLAYDWTGTDSLVFLAQEDASFYEKERKRKEDTSTVVEDEKHEPPVRLFEVEIESKKVTRLTENTDRILLLSVSPDGKKAVTVHGRSLSYEYDHRIKPQAYLTDLATGARKLLFAEQPRNVAAVRWSPDSKSFYVSVLFTNHPRYVQATVTELYHVDAGTGQDRKVELNWERGLADQVENDYREGFAVVRDGFIALLADGVHFRPARYTRTARGWERHWLTGEGFDHVYGLTASPDGKRLVFCRSTPTTPAQWYHAGLDGAKVGKAVVLTKLNESLQGLTHAKAEAVRWKGALNEEVEGTLHYPHDYQQGKKYPLVVMIHGGPFGADYLNWDDNWAYPINLVCQRGAFVLRPNYHGSSSYGLKFAESIAGGKYYDLPLRDIETGVDALITRGLVDPGKLATMGWSNGAILSAALIAQNQRYRAASLGAGGAEWVADWGACEFGLTFSNYYFGKSPLEDPELYRRMAPLYQFDRVRTPTIIFHGEADRAVPTHHAWAQFRTLQQLGKTDVRLLLFPEEPHSLEKLAHQRRKVAEELAWLDRHLFGTAKPENEAFKTSSPLARVLQLKNARREGTRFGVLVKDVLTPETVEYEGLQVGRFEVTQAQYAAFDRNFKMEPGRENFPITGIPFEKAREYCRWLSEKTGQTYRLPSADDAETLYDEDETAGENTLDYWAGYTVNPDDARRLQEKISQLSGKTPLLREAGQFRGAGKEDQVFDLGGNAAEWVEAEGGKGKVQGGCAATPAGTRGKTQPPADYVGFRVVKVVKK